MGGNDYFLIKIKLSLAHVANWLQLFTSIEKGSKQGSETILEKQVREPVSEKVCEKVSETSWRKRFAKKWANEWVSVCNFSDTGLQHVHRHSETFSYLWIWFWVPFACPKSWSHQARLSSPRVSFSSLSITSFDKMFGFNQPFHSPVCPLSKVLKFFKGWLP